LGEQVRCALLVRQMRRASGDGEQNAQHVKGALPVRPLQISERETEKAGSNPFCKRSNERGRPAASLFARRRGFPSPRQKRGNGLLAKVQPDAASFEAPVTIGRVLNPFDSARLQEHAQRLPPRRKQRTYKPNATSIERGGRDAREPPALTAGEAHGDGFGLIVDGMPSQ